VTPKRSLTQVTSNRKSTPSRCCHPTLPRRTSLEASSAAEFPEAKERMGNSVITALYTPNDHLRHDRSAPPAHAPTADQKEHIPKTVTVLRTNRIYASYRLRSSNHEDQCWVQLAAPFSVDITLVDISYLKSSGRVHPIP
jgi:hypothetical protein